MEKEIKCSGISCSNSNPVLGTVTLASENDYKGDAYYGLLCSGTHDAIAIAPGSLIKMTTSQRTGYAAEEGNQVYDTDLQQSFYYNGTNWIGY
jgi:hypothetical protein